MAALGLNGGSTVWCYLSDYILPYEQLQFFFSEKEGENKANAMSL